MSLVQFTGDAVTRWSGEHQYMTQPLAWVNGGTDIPDTFDNASWWVVLNSGMGFAEYAMNENIYCNHLIYDGTSWSTAVSGYAFQWGEQGVTYYYNMWNQKGKSTVTFSGITSNTQFKVTTGESGYTNSSLTIPFASFSAHCVTKLKANLSHCSATYQVIARPSGNDWTTLNSTVTAGSNVYYGCTIRATFTYDAGYTGVATKDFVLGDGDSRVITHAGTASYVPTKIYNNGWKNAEVYIYNNGWKKVKPYVYNNGWRELNG